jgi:rhodanese-related sulfurtransferase
MTLPNHNALSNTPSRSSQLVQAAMARVTTLSAAQALALHGQSGVLFVDIREPAEWAREGTVPGAVLAPRGVLEFWVDPDSPWHRAEFALPVHGQGQGQRQGQPQPQWLLYCAIGWRSALAAQMLQEMGFKNVSHLGGGLTAWKAAGGPVDLPAPVTATASPRTS